MSESQIMADSSYYGEHDYDQSFDQDDASAIKDLLLGHSVKKVSKDHLQLDDGTLLKIVPNQGGCACSAGDYHLRDLNEVGNIITKVEVVRLDGQADWDNDKWDDTSYRIYVWAEDKKLKLVQIDGDDGNGYYGTGYEVFVRFRKTPENSRTGRIRI